MGVALYGSKQENVEDLVAHIQGVSGGQDPTLKRVTEKSIVLHKKKIKKVKKNKEKATGKPAAPIVCYDGNCDDTVTTTMTTWTF